MYGLSGRHSILLPLLVCACQSVRAVPPILGVAMRSLMPLVLASAVLGACGSSGTPFTQPEEDLSPSTVVASNVRVVATSSSETVTLHLKNNGPQGFYRVEFFAIPLAGTTWNRLVLGSDAFYVPADYDADVPFTVTGPAYTFPVTDWIVIYNRAFAGAGDWTASQCMATGRSASISCPAQF